MKDALLPHTCWDTTSVLRPGGVTGIDKTNTDHVEVSVPRPNLPFSQASSFAIPSLFLPTASIDSDRYTDGLNGSDSMLHPSRVSACQGSNDEDNFDQYFDF